MNKEPEEDIRVEEEKVTASFETNVNFKMICYYIYAWITNKSVVHTKIQVNKKK